MTAETLVWADGRPGWEPLGSVPVLWEHASTAAQPPAASQPAAAALAGALDSAAAPAMQPDGGAHVEAEKPVAGAVAQQTSRRKAAVVAKAAPAKAAPEDNELAAFQAEMSALGAVAAPGPEVEDPLRADTPEPEDRRFQDDDGTWYIWDALLRKFVEEVSRPSDDCRARCASEVTMHLWLSHIHCACACCISVGVHGQSSASLINGFEAHLELWRPQLQGAQPLMPEYRPEDMVFEMEEEKIPIYKPPQPEGSDAEDEADGIAEGAEPEDGGDAWRPSACRNATPLHQTQSLYQGCILLPDLLSLGRR